MTNVLLRVLLWSVAYFLVALVPLGVAMLGTTPPGRGFLIEFGVGLGMVGYAMLGLQFVTTSRFRWVAPYFGTDAQIQFHRETGLLTLAFVLGHPLVLLAVQPAYFEFLNPWSNLPRAVFLSAATIAMISLVATSLWRISFRMSYEWWRLTHGALAALVIVVGLAHSLQVGHYVTGYGKQTVWVLGTGVMIYLLFDSRVLKPYRMRKRPWRVTQVREICPEVHALTLEPIGPHRMSFRAGQYAWLTVGDTPFTLQQHPFSFSSSAEHTEQLEFAIKVTGDFTSKIPELRPGTNAYVEGPYGRFTLDPQAAGAVFIVGGIGVTPVMSILRTCRDRRERRPLMVIYANNQWEDIAYRRELDELRTQLDLKIVHVLDKPPDEWEGESGFIDGELLSRHLNKHPEQDLQYLICGPTPLMNVVEKALVKRGVPHWRLVSERFDMV